MARRRANNRVRSAVVAEVMQTEEDRLEAVAVDWANKVRVEVLVCRQFGHAWGAGVNRLYRVNSQFNAREIVCSRCGMKRVDIVEHGQWTAWRRKYEPPHDYSRERTEGSVKIPRYVVAEQMEARADVLEPPQHIQELFSKWR